jgi:hemolysin D
MDSSKKIEDRQPASGQLAKLEPAELRPVRPNANLANRDESSLFTATNFGQSVVFQQSQVWSRAIVWGIMGITASLVTWACFARIEEAVATQGKLESFNDVNAKKQLFKSELSSSNGGTLTAEQQNRLRTNNAESNSHETASKLEVLQVRQQQKENIERRKDLNDQVIAYRDYLAILKAGEQYSRALLAYELAQINRQLGQNAARITAAQQLVNSNQAILNDLQPAFREGAIARVQISRQEQEVNTRKSELEQQNQEQERLQIEKQRLFSSHRIESQNRQQLIQKQEQLINQQTSEIAQLKKEFLRLQKISNKSLKRPKL